MFCGICINPERPLTNYKLIDDIANELAGKLKIQQLQDLLAEAWKPYMRDLDSMYTDATYYESEMRYPTDQKLLWECVGKPYVRLIVRGKEAKNVEFGAKCNNIMLDGLSFIEKLSFNAFNEGTRLQHSVKMHKRLFLVDVKKVGGDHFLRDPHRQCGATCRADDGTAEGESCLKGRL